MENLKLSIGVIIGTLVLVVGVVGVALLLDTPDQIAIEESTGDIQNARVRGNRQAEIVIVEFSDFQCPACRAASPELKRFVEEFSDKVQLIYRHFPLTQHQNARTAAYAAEAAGEQGFFWEAHDWLFENQDLWAERTVDANYFYNEFSGAGVMKLDSEQFSTDYQSDEIRNRVSSDLNDGSNLGVSSTPTFYINGQKNVGVVSYDELVRLTGLGETTQ